MSDDMIESDIPDLTGVSLEELRSNPKYRAIADRLAEQLRDLPDNGVIVCTHPFEVE